MAEHILTGEKGEQQALRYLLGLGYQLEARNWRYKHLEVDLIMRDGEVLVFVEVKTRASGTYGLPYEAVDWQKQRKLARAATIFIGQQKHQGEIRFDVVSILMNDQKEFNLRHIKDAFWPRYA